MDSSRNAVELRDVTIRLGRTTVQAGMDAEIGEGEFVAVLGPNGAGKSTLLKALLGLLRPAEGSIGVFGRSPKLGNRQIGYVPQFHSLESAMVLRSRDIVGFGLDGHRWGPGLGGKKRRERIDRALDEVDVLHLAEVPFGRLSGGERQRMILAQALLSEPSLLLLDEPLASLDIHHAQDIVSLVNRTCRGRGVTVLLVAHDVNPLLPFVDRIMYLANQRCRVGKPEEVITTDSLSALYGSRVEVVRSLGRLFVIGAEI